MFDVIPYGRQQISEKDIESVLHVLGSDYLTQGPVVPEFEKAVSGKCKSNYAVAVNSATSALHIACLALGVGSGDVVWTTPNTFVASANCALYCGATVDFVDIDADTWCLGINQLNEKLKYHQKMDLPLPKVVIPVHLSGQSCEMEAIAKLGEQYKFRIIEDASHAIGGNYQNEPVGDCRYSDITVFSFHAVKIITTGEGGMALTNNPDIYKVMNRLRSHGITRNKKEMVFKQKGPWYYEQQNLGFNYRITDIQAALGLSQLKRINQFVKKRNNISNYYDENLNNLHLKKQLLPENTYSSKHLYIIQVESNIHLKLFNYLINNNIGVNLHYIPLHLQPYYRDLGFNEGDYPESENHGDKAISLPIYPDLKKSKLNYIIKMLNNFFNNDDISNISKISNEL
jgi:UDP-4-amino-4,6-dideoxy-N-acetyl-beta-L-altrosamine transaminase